MTPDQNTNEESKQIAVPVEAVEQLPAQPAKIDYEDLFKSAIGKHSNDEKWSEGKFIGIKTLSNTKVGSVGQDFIEALCNALNIPILFPENEAKKRLNQSPWDLKLHAITFELKTATEDTSGNFQFNHIRYHRKYEAALVLGVSPDQLFFNIYSKADLTTGKVGNLVTMEKGANASFKLTRSKSQLFPIDQFEEKLKEFVTAFVK